MTIDLTPPTPLWLASQGDLLDTHAMKVARSWLESGAWGLLMLGDVGRGKSQAAAWLWEALRNKARFEGKAPEVLWLPARAVEHMQWSERNDVLSRCQRCYGLIVDELGAEQDRTSRDLSTVIERRGDAKLFTVMTTNLPPADIVEDGKLVAPGFASVYGDRLISRLRAGGLKENGSTRWAVVVRGDDLRSAVIPSTAAPDEDEEAPASPDVIVDLSDRIIRLTQPVANDNSHSTARVTGRLDDDAAMRELQVRRVRGQLALDELEQRASQGCEASRAVLEAIDRRHQSALIPGHEDAG